MHLHRLEPHIKVIKKVVSKLVHQYDVLKTVNIIPSQLRNDINISEHGQDRPHAGRVETLRHVEFTETGNRGHQPFYHPD